MKAKKKYSTVVKAVLFILAMSLTFVLGWFLMIRTENETSHHLLEAGGSEEIVSTSTDGSLSVVDESWDWIQQWLVDNEFQMNERRTAENIDHLEITRTYKGTENYEIGFGGFAGEYDDFTVSWSLDHPQERLNIRLSNETSDYYPVLLKLFYNYETVNFRIVGEDDYRSELFIELSPGYEYIIPFHLDSTLEAHVGYSKLTMAAFFDSDQYSVFHGWGHYLDAAALTAEISYESDEQFVLDRVQHPLEERPEFGNTVPLITMGTPGGITPDYFLGPGRPRQVYPGEELEIEVLLNVRGSVWNPDTGERKEVEDFLMIGLLDFEQIELSESPFLWSSASLVPLFGYFTIEAPTEPGLYDFIAIIVENPTGGMTEDNFIPHEMSNRFTIEVIGN